MADTDPPGFLMTSEPGSFAQKTILSRNPDIIDRAIAENNYPLFINERLGDLKDELLSGKIQPFSEDAPDVDEWNRLWARFKEKTWLDLPWYFAESYFYRRLLEEVMYFQHGPLQGLDPFEKSKRKQLEESIAPISLAIDAIDKINEPRLCLENQLHASLWGNRIDLSNLMITDEVRRRQAMIERENLLINDFSTFTEILNRHHPLHIAFINDNVGIELGFDLCLADFLIREEYVNKITFYLKPYPFFVSDAMIKDLQETVHAFTESPSFNLKRLGERIQKALCAETIHLSTDWFWASFHHFCEMPKKLYEEMSRLDMVIIKGDANYRRLLSDRHWIYTMPITKIVQYFPTSILILRTLKGEIIVGLKYGQVEELQAEDPEWLINGKRGIIQYVELKHSPISPVTNT